MVDIAALRPLERRVLRLLDEGIDGAEIARRFNRSPEFVTRVVEFTRMARGGGVGEVPSSGPLRPLERRILSWRAGGADHVEIGRRFHRSAGHVQRVEQLARYKLSTS